MAPAPVKLPARPGRFPPRRCRPPSPDPRRSPGSALAPVLARERRSDDPRDGGRSGDTKAETVRVVFMRVVLLRRCRSGDGERQRRGPDRRHGQKKSAEWHETNSFGLVSRYRVFRVFSAAWYSERRPRSSLWIRKGPAELANGVAEISASSWLRPRDERQKFARAIDGGKPRAVGGTCAGRDARSVPADRAHARLCAPCGQGDRCAN